MKHTLEVYSKTKLIFYSDGKWLHPLFELENFLATNELDPSQLLVKDKIIGRAAALILVYLGIKKVHAGILSEPGQESLEKQNIAFEYDMSVKRILCRTEELLKNENDPETAYLLIKKLAEASQHEAKQ